MRLLSPCCQAPGGSLSGTTCLQVCKPVISYVLPCASASVSLMASVLRFVVMGLPFDGLLRNLQFKLTGNPTPFSIHCQNRRLATGGYSPIVARGKVRNTLGAGAVGGLSIFFTRA